MRKRLILGCCALAALVMPAAGTAFAEKVSVEMRGQPRPLPAAAYMVGSYDEQGRPDACIIDRVGIADRRCPLPWQHHIHSLEQLHKFASAPEGESKDWAVHSAKHPPPVTSRRVRS